ncbi:MAG: c-type cytochrome [Verrucomicrobia bacterium]|nr:c-type cytochrome [Verrucomicrobiota bacterium]
MSKLDAKSLAREVASPLLWRRQTAQRLLVERGDTSVAAELREVLSASRAGDLQSPPARSDGSKAATATRRHVEPAALITALRTLDGLGALTPEDVRPFVSHSADSVRVHALQLADRWLVQPEGRALLATTLAAAATEPSPRVQIQFALSLGESRDPRAFALLARFARERLGVRWMDTAILSSLHQRGGEMLVELLREPGGSAPLLEALAKSIAASRDEAELARALNLLAAARPETQATVLDGLAKGRKNAPRKPLADKSARASLAKLAASPDAAVRTVTRALEDTFVLATTEGETFTGPAVAATTEVSDATFRKFVAALSATRDAKRGHEVFNLACATCHRIGKEGHNFGPDLLGELGVAEETLVRHMLLPNERIRPGYETTVAVTHDGASVVGLLKDDGATSLTLAQPNGVEQVLLRKDVTGVRRIAGSLMPSFAEALTPADLASLLTWLRSNLRADTGVRAVLFDEEPGFAALLKEESGTATIESTGAAFGKLCLRISPPQRAAKQLPGWNYRVVEKPAATNEFRFLRLTWKSSGPGVMVELARSGQWPKAEDQNGRYYAGRNTTQWKARQASTAVPREWDTVTLDLWKDMGTFTLTGLAPTAMGGDAWFDRIELLR